ncbi:cytochrome P450 [Cladochytrium replicatum]|nr:cytochrome P450 [Cladochytrium replicatum]
MEHWILLVPIVLLAYLYYVEYIVGGQFKTPHGSVPFLGIFQIAQGKKKDQSFLRWLVDQQRKLGSIYEYRILGKRSIIISDAEEIRKVLESSEIFIRGSGMQASASGMFQYSLFLLPSGEKHQRRREIMIKALGGNQLPEVSLRLLFPMVVSQVQTLKTTVSVGQVLLNAWSIWPKETSANDQHGFEKSLHPVINLTSHITSALLDIISISFFGYDFMLVADLANESLGEHRHATPKAIKSLTGLNRILGSRIGSLFGFNWMFSSGLRALGRESEYLRMHSLSAFEARRRLRMVKKLGPQKAKEAGFVVSHKGDEEKMLSAPTVLLDRMIESKDYLDETKPATIDGDAYIDIGDEIMGLMFACTEKCSQIVISFIIELSNNPAVYETIIGEIKSHVKPNARITPEVLNELRELDLALKETMRLYPSIPLIFRKLSKDTTIAGKHVKAGTEVIANITALHTDSKYWGDHAEEFDPNRWKVLAQNGQNYFPFGAGAMACPGQMIAMTLMKAFVVTILRQYRFEVAKGLDLVVVDGYTCTPKDDVYAQVISLS